MLDRSASTPSGAPTGAPRRTFLFLQGLATPFLRKLAVRLRRMGHRTLRVNLTSGDALFWRFLGRHYRWSPAGWPDWVEALMRREAVTDLVVFSDGRPYHARAIERARGLGITVHVLEEGYLRPAWLTLERGGANANSNLPRDRAGIEAAARAIPREPPDEHYGVALGHRARWEVVYQGTNLLFGWFYPGYRRHRPFHPLVEGWGWLRKTLRKKERRRHAHAMWERFKADKPPFFLVPLQLDSDVQLRLHSDFKGGVGEMIERVIASFAAHAPADAELLFKVHPLDNGVFDRDAQVAGPARARGVENRVSIVHDGDLDQMLDACRGVVVINSTVGLAALGFRGVGRPVKVLGRAMYDVDGMTDQAPLDAFWRAPSPPDPALVADFLHLVRGATQVNGSFFDPVGIERGIEIAAEMMTAPDGPWRVLADLEAERVRK